MKIANQWQDVTLGEYIKITDLQQVDMDELDRYIKIISILSGESEEYISSLPLTVIKKCIASISFLNTPHKGHLKPVLKIDGKKYNVLYDFREITGGEYIDLVSLLKDKEEVNRNLPAILAIFIKNKKKQTLKDRIENAKIFEKHLTMDEVMVLSAFFLNSCVALTNLIADYSAKKLIKERKSLLKIIKDSKNIGGGS